jgi:hypothetical protein
VPPPVPPLQNGDRLTREEFERRYAAMPHLKKAELLDGIVYLGAAERLNGVDGMSSPVSHSYHSSPHFDLIGWLFLYRMATPGVEGGDNGTLRIALIDNEPQPDAYLRIAPAHGGQSRTSEDGYVEGTPEWLGEVAASSASYDLHHKLDVYRRAGAREYVVWRVYDQAIDWFILREGRFDRLPLTATGHYQSEVIPGLWLDPAALIRGDLTAVAQVAQQGLATPEHAAFVARLRSAGQPNPT